MYFRWAALMAPDPFWREARAEFAGGEGIQGAEAGGKLDLGQVAPEASCSFRSSLRSRKLIRLAPAQTTALQKTPKIRAAPKDGPPADDFLRRTRPPASAPLFKPTPSRVNPSPDPHPAPAAS